MNVDADKGDGDMVVRDGKLVKQTDIVREAVKAGEWKKALRIAKDFRINVTKEQRDTMSRAYDKLNR